jgi:hypothetical protein
MDALTHKDNTTALHRAYLEAMQRAAEERAACVEPTNETILRAHRRAAAIERLRASVVDIDLA